MISATIMYALEEVEVITTRIIHTNAAGARFSFFLRAAAPPLRRLRRLRAAAPPSLMMFLLKLADVL
jgi:hypothetical protein